MLRVPLEVKSIDAPSNNILSTPATAIAKEHLVVALTVQLALILKELALRERHEALDTHKAVWVPLHVGSTDHLGCQSFTAHNAGIRHLGDSFTKFS